MSDDSKNDKTTDVIDDETGAVEDPETTTEVVEETADPADPEDVDSAEVEPDASDATDARPKRSIQWSRVVAFGLLPALALVLALGAGFLKWQNDAMRDSAIGEAGSAATESVQAAKDSTIALLSYAPDTVEEQLGAARDLLTGQFRQSYTDLTNDVVIPGAKQKQISAVASVPAAASVSVDQDKAVVLLFVNQTVTVGQDPPTDTASSVRVTLDKVGDRWLISQFDPV